MDRSSNTEISVNTPNLNIIIIGNDGDRETIARINPAIKNIIEMASRSLVQAGFKVYDETLILMDNFTQGNSRRTEVEIFEVLRGIDRPPLDIVVIFEVRPEIKRGDLQTLYNIYVNGRILAINGGKNVNNFAIKLADMENTHVHCYNKCINKFVRKHSKYLGQELGVVLVDKINHYLTLADPNSKKIKFIREFYLTFSGFNGAELEKIQDIIKNFSGYQFHRPIMETMRYAEYLYEYSEEVAKLTRNLRKMVNSINTEARVACARNKCSIEKISF